MSVLVIQSDKQSHKILTALAKKLGSNVFDINDHQFEDLMLGKMMDKVKTGKTVSKTSILNKLKGY